MGFAQGVGYCAYAQKHKGLCTRSQAPLCTLKRIKIMVKQKRQRESQIRIMRARLKSLEMRKANLLKQFEELKETLEADIKMRQNISKSLPRNDEFNNEIAKDMEEIEMRLASTQKTMIAIKNEAERIESMITSKMAALDSVVDSIKVPA